MSSLNSTGLPGQSLHYRKKIFNGHQAEFHNGAALRFDDGMGDGSYCRVSLRSQTDGLFHVLENCREGYCPREDGDPLEIYKHDWSYYGTRQVIHPDGTSDILYGHFVSGWPSKTWVPKLTFIGKEPGKLPPGLRESEDGKSIITGDLAFNRIPLPVKPAFFTLKEPNGSDMAIMAEDIRKAAGPAVAKLGPVIETRFVGRDIF